MTSKFKPLSIVLLLASLMGTAAAQSPQTPAQPSAEFYSTAALNLFPTYTRASYTGATGNRAPICDPTRAIKTWYDLTVNTSAAGNLALYNQIGSGAETQLVLPAIEAASVNLPGIETYPPFVVAQTTLTVDGKNLVNTNILATQSQATALAALLGPGVQVVAGPALIDIGPVADPRNDWLLQGGGLSSAYYAGGFLAEQNANGVGAPGSFAIVGGAGVWTPTPQPDCSGVVAVRPVPVRSLMSNEAFTSGAVPGSFMIVRTDLQTQANAAGNVFTVADRAMLAQILSLLQAAKQ